MSNNRINFKELIESITKLKVYPIVIPQKVKYPCISLSVTGGARDGDSNLSVSNIKGYRVSITICSDKVSVNNSYEEKLITALDGKTITTNDTKSMMYYHENTLEIFNYTQSLHEMTVDFSTKILN